MSSRMVIGLFWNPHHYLGNIYIYTIVDFRYPLLFLGHVGTSPLFRPYMDVSVQGFLLFLVVIGSFLGYVPQYCQHMNMSSRDCCCFYHCKEYFRILSSYRNLGYSTTVGSILGYHCLGQNVCQLGDFDIFDFCHLGVYGYVPV